MRRFVGFFLMKKEDFFLMDFKPQKSEVKVAQKSKQATNCLRYCTNDIQLLKVKINRCSIGKEGQMIICFKNEIVGALSTL